MIFHPHAALTSWAPGTTNSSILGNGVYFWAAHWLILFLRILFTAITFGALWLLYRYYRTGDPLFWFTTVGRAAAVVVAGGCCWPRATTR